MLEFSGNIAEQFLPNFPNKGGDSFEAGDIRSNENPMLASLHTLWLREHNRIAIAMVEDFGYDPIADDNLIFETARRIVGAEMQNVVFGQYLTKVLGEKTMLIGKLGPT